MPGGGVALLRAIEAVKEVKAKGDERIGVDIVVRALEAPIRQIASNSGECPNSGSAAPSALTPRMMAVETPPRSCASTRRHTQGVANALMPIRLQNALWAAAPPP